MLKTRIKKIADHCTSACRAVALITAGEIYTFMHTTLHGDFVTAYLVGSAWIKDRLVKHFQKRETRVVRKTVHIAPPSAKERHALLEQAIHKGDIKGFW